jgi:hypothetical protein
MLRLPARLKYWLDGARSYSSDDWESSMSLRPRRSLYWFTGTASALAIRAGKRESLWPVFK